MPFQIVDGVMDVKICEKQRYFLFFAGNNHLGGEDVTNNLLRHFLEDIKTR